MNKRKLNLARGIVAVLLALEICKNREPSKAKKSVRCRSIRSRKYLERRNQLVVFKEMELDDMFTFRTYYSMSKSTFYKLLAMVQPLIAKEDTVMREAIPARVRLLLTLRFLATGESFRSMSVAFRVSSAALSKIIPETLIAVCEVLEREFFEIPQTAEKWFAIADEFANIWDFPNCLGALDGKHIAFRRRTSKTTLYHNYKGFNSIILLALVDANYNFLNVDVSINGGANDASNYDNSFLYEGIESGHFDFPPNTMLPGIEGEVPYVIVADEAFKPTKRIMSLQRLECDEPDRNFICRASHAKRVVDNAFSILTRKFRILQKSIEMDVDKVRLITYSACVLHNFLRKEEPDDCDIDIDVTTELVDNMVLAPLEHSIFEISDDALDVRNKYTQYFNNAGAVPWQKHAVCEFN